MVFAETIVRCCFTRIRPRILNDSSEDEVDRQASGRLLVTLQTRKRRRIRLPRGVSLLLRIRSTATLLVSLAYAQDRPSQNEFAFWFEGQLGNGHAFASATDSRMYPIEARYGCIVYTNRLLALRYIAEVIPFSVVGDPQANGQRCVCSRYWRESHRGTNQFPLPSQGPAISDERRGLFILRPADVRRYAVQFHRPACGGRASIHFEAPQRAVWLEYITFPMPTWAASTPAWTRT
jgi:hypothetical protein